MPDVREVYEQVASRAPAQPDPLARQLREQRRHAARRRNGAFAVAAGIVVLAVIVSVRASEGGSGEVPLRPSPSIPATSSPLPVLASGSYLLNVRTGGVVSFSPVDGGCAWATSPDGQLVAFNKDDDAGVRQVWIAGVDTAPRQLTDLPYATAPLWSPDGRWLAFSAGWDSGEPQVYVVEVASGTLTQVTHEPNGAADPGWTPDGSRLVYAARRVGKPIDKLPFLPEYYLVREIDLTTIGPRLVGSDPRTLIGSKQGFASMPAVSPDGSTIAFVHGGPVAQSVRGGGIRLLHLGDGTSTELVPAMDGLADPQWSPDGRTISFKVDGPDGRWEAWTVDVVTGRITRLSSGYPFTWEDADTVHIDVG